jgi:hypothetical protein
VDFERKRRFESVYSNKVRAGRRRTYFFDVRKTRGNDYYLTITESKKRFDGEGYERHKIFLYKEDFNRFLEGLNETITHIKSDLMPDYDYDEYTRRHDDYDDDNDELYENEDTEIPKSKDVLEEDVIEKDVIEKKYNFEDEDLSW